VRDTVITHSRLAWRHEREQAALASHHGLQALPIEGLAARLAGGFLQPIDPDALKAAVTKALSADLGDLDRIKELPGFPRAAAATLSKAWAAGLNLASVGAADGAPPLRYRKFARLSAGGRWIRTIGSPSELNIRRSPAAGKRVSSSRPATGCIGRKGDSNLYGAFPVKRLFWVVLTVFCSERERPFFVL
jgi:hypothetical protein